MPLEQRVVEPIAISRGTLPLDSHGNLAISIPNELECVTNGSLANVIRQLSSLSRYAEDLFGGIVNETSGLINRASQLQGRIDRLAVKVTQLDSSVEEISLHDIHLKKPFKSNSSYDQQIVSRSTIPASILERYNLCDKPPPLSKLNPYRDDGKDGLKFYTDSGYFFELWKQEMLQISQKARNVQSIKNAANGHHHSHSHSHHHGQNQVVAKNGTMRDKKNPRQPVSTQLRFQEAAQKHGEFIQNPHSMNNGGDNSTYGQLGHHSQPPMNGAMNGHGYVQRPNSLEVSQQEQYQQQQLQIQQQQQSMYQHANGTSSNYQSGNVAMTNKLMSPMGGDRSAAYSEYHPNSSQSSPGSHTPTNRRGSAAHQNRPSQPPPAPPSNPSSNNSSGQVTPLGTPSRSRSVTKDRESLGLPPPPPPPPPPAGFDSPMNGGGHMAGDLPPPPPGHGNNGMMMGARNSNMIPQGNAMSSGAAPPPPPPPPPMGNDGTDGIAAPPSFASQIQMRQQQLQPPKISTANKVLPPHHVAQVDARSGLLAAIREGVKLRRIEDSKQKEVEKSAPCNDVASILARRVAMEISDSDSDGHSGSESEAWDEES